MPSFFSQVLLTCSRIALSGFALNSGCCITALNRAISFCISFPLGRTLTSILRARACRSCAMISSSDDSRESKFTVVVFFFFDRFCFCFIGVLSWISSKGGHQLIAIYDLGMRNVLLRKASCRACRFSSFVRWEDSIPEGGWSVMVYVAAAARCTNRGRFVGFPI
jgi:hypothetical protein